MDIPETFRCERQRMTLTPAGCARLWVAAKQPGVQPWDGKWVCRGCPIGAQNAGASAAEVSKSVAADALRTVCPRCPQRRSTRLIDGKLCISCYNRDREAARGRNCKGNPPRLMAVLHTRSVVVDGAPRAFDRVTGMVEVLIRAAKAAAGAPVVIGLAPLRFALPAEAPA